MDHVILMMMTVMMMMMIIIMHKNLRRDKSTVVVDCWSTSGDTLEFC